MAQIWDVVVIGAGAAGLTAARVARAAGLSCLCVDRLGPGGELINLGVLHECPDLPEGTTGAELMTTLADAATEAGVELAVGEVRALRRAEPWLIVADDMEYAARAVIIATGLAPGTLGVAGEEAFEGLGLSHCASCDGPLCQGESVIVAGGGPWALQEAIDLASMAGDVTLIVPPGDQPPSGERAARLGAVANVRMMAGRIVGLEGVNGLDGVIVERGDARKALPARAVFVQSNRRAALGFAAGVLALDNEGRAVVDGDLRIGNARAYAAGDVRSGAAERISAAIADGERAGISVARQLSGAAARNDG